MEITKRGHDLVGVGTMGYGFVSVLKVAWTVHCPQISFGKSANLTLVIFQLMKQPPRPECK